MGSRLKTISLILILVFLAQALSLATIPLPVKAAPLIIDRIVYSEAEDGDVVSADTNWTIAWNADVGDTVEDGQTVTMGGYFHVFYYYIYRPFGFFDTSMIPASANITNATLSLYITMNATETPFNLTIQNGMPTYPHSPLVVGDFDKDHYSGSGGSRNTTDGCDDNAWWNITLTSTGISWININGLTKFALRTTLDINGTPQNNTVEYIQWGTLESGVPPRLYLTYEVPEAAMYILRGAYSEDGNRDGAINATIYKETFGSETYEVDGNQTVYAEQIAICFKFDLGYNNTRIYYLYHNETFEEIFIVKPSEPYYTYTFDMLDYVGVTNGYLETILNLNGTDRVIERWDINVLNELPFTLSWGVAYKIRLVCDQGVYYYPDFVAGATVSVLLTISSDMFPDIPTDISQIQVSATRYNISWIQTVYNDAQAQTTWIYLAIYDSGNTTAVYTTNVTASTLTHNWYDGDENTNYYVYVIAYHQVRGQLTWLLPCALPEEGENPWENLTTLLGTEGFPFDIDQLFAALIILFTFGAFSWKNAGVGLIVGTLVAAFLAWMGWSAISTSWLTSAIAVAFIIAVSIHKDRDRVIM